MDINATLLGQMITFVLFVWFTMKFVWPPLTTALRERQEKIAEGLAASERGHQALELAQQNAAEQLREAKKQAAEIIDHANKRGTQLVEEAKLQARKEAERLVEMAKAEIKTEVNSTKQQLRQQLASLAVSGASRILGREIDAAANNEIIEGLINEL